MPDASTDPSCNPERLTELVLRGDAAALDQLTRCYGERLLSAGRRHCRTLEEAEDAVQDALLTASDRMSSFRGEGSVEGWLVRIVATACRRQRRGQKNDTARHDSELSPVDGAESPEEWVARREVGAQLEASLLELSALDRGILLLAEVEEFSAPEIAERLGTSPGAVRTRLTRMRARLRALLDPRLSYSDRGL